MGTEWLDQAPDASWLDNAPDAEVPKANPAGPGRAQALGRGAIQGASLGFGDEIAGVQNAVMRYGNEPVQALVNWAASRLTGQDTPSPVELYKQGRDEQRAANKAAKDAHGGFYLAGEIGGGALPALLPGGAATKAVGLVPKIAAGVNAAAPIGAAMGLGASEASTIPGLAGDTALGAATAGGIGGAAPLLGAAVRPVLEPTARFLKGAAITQGRKALSGIGTALSARKPIAEEAVQQALDTGAIRPLSTVQGIAQRLEGAADELGPEYARILGDLEAAGVQGPNAVLMARKLSAEAKQAAKTSLRSPRPGMLEDAAQELVTKVNPAPFASKNLGLLQAEEIKRGLQKEARADYDKLTRQFRTTGETKKELAAFVRQEIEQSVQNQAALAPDAAAAFMPVKTKLSRTLEALKAAEEGAARASRRKGVSLTSTIAGGAAGASLGPTAGVLTALGHGIVDRRLASTLAALANYGGKGLSAVANRSAALSQPEVERFTAALAEAMRRERAAQMTPVLAEDNGS